MKGLKRTIHPDIRVIDQRRGIVEYVASDESIDSYREVIRARGWRFGRFSRNAPFVDSHEYDSIDRQLGRVIDYRVQGDKLIETVQWAIDVPENNLARLGWRMTVAGYLRAVSVGFIPIKTIRQGDPEYNNQLLELGNPEPPPRRIFVEQEQVELSAVLIGANPNAVARAFRAEVIDEDDITAWYNALGETSYLAGPRIISSPLENPAASADTPDGAESAAKRQARERFLTVLRNITKG